MEKIGAMVEKLVIISGPTASGKTSLAIDVALWIKEKCQKSAAIVNFDSLCFYQEINIGTAKPTRQEQHTVEHQMINIAKIDHAISAADFIRMATPIIQKLHEEKKIVILVGGSAFYLRALIKGMYEKNQASHSPPVSNMMSINDLTRQEKWELLIEKDPINAKKLHPNDYYRIDRALEYFAIHGIPFSKASLSIEDPYDFSKSRFPYWQLIHFYLDWPKEILWQRIKARTEQIFENGIIDEYKKIIAQGYSGNERPLQSIGHLQVSQFLKGEIATLDECRDKVAIATRQLAKSQRTFFNKITPKHIIDPRTTGQIYRILQEFLHCPTTSENKE